MVHFRPAKVAHFDPARVVHFSPARVVYYVRRLQLGYRTVSFEENRFRGDYQGNAIINFTDLSVPYTRIHEHKHFSPGKSFKDSIYFKEYSRETCSDDEPYYPKRLASDKLKLDKYLNETNSMAKFTFLGRLGTYRYMDMDLVVREALDISKKFITECMK